MARRNTFQEDEELVNSINFRDIARVTAYMKPLKARIMRVVNVIILMGAILVLVPYLTKVMIDTVIPSGNVSDLLILGGVFAVAILIYELCLRYRTVAIAYIGQKMLKNMRRDISPTCKNCRSPILIPAPTARS